MAEMTEIWYPGPEDLGIDEGTQSRIASIILDQSLPLAPSGRSPEQNRGVWEEESLLMYGRWLCALLDLDSLRPLTERIMDRASKLGLGPSYLIIYHTDSIGSLTEYQKRLECAPLFTDWTKDRCLREGIKLSQKYGRLGTKELDEFASKGRFLSSTMVKRRFGSLGIFHEQTGYPSVRGWDREDYIEWGMAFMRQNPGMRLDFTAITTLSKRKVGPSANAIAKNFHRIPPFRDELEARFAEEVRRRQQEYDMTQAEIKQSIESGRVPEALFAGQPDETHFKLYGMYQVGASFLPLNYELMKIAQTKDPDVSVQHIVRNTPNATAAEVEIRAEELGVYDYIWPSVRFENVNLRLDDTLAA